MPQRSSVLDAFAPNSLRRSPRFTHLQDSPRTPKPITKNPVFLSPLTPHSNPIKGSTISGKISSMSLNKSVNGSSNIVKSANGLRKITRLRGNVNGFEARRQSSRFRNEVNSSVDIHINGKVDGSICCKSGSNRGSKKELNLMGKKIVDLTVTPIIDGERKLIGDNGKDFDAETSGSCREISLNLGKRITRSQSRLKSRNIEVGKTAEDKQIGCNSVKHCTGGVNSRIILSSIQSSVVRVDGEVRGISCSEGKENRMDNGKGLISGSRNVSSASRKGRQHNITGYSGKDGKIGDSCKQVVVGSDARMIRSETKQTRKENATRDLTKKEEESKDRVELEVGKVEKETRDALPNCLVLGRAEKKEQDSSKDTKLTGVKRKRNQVGLQGTNEGWTKEQEVELHKAYFTTKPSPHFWKKVAKLVPGKSAQECFDKVHSGNQTPVCSKLASRTRKQKSPSYFLVSGSKLFESSEKSKSKKTCKMKCKSQVARKTVRHLLQKYCHVNQDNEADLFSVLEPSVTPSSESYQVTPESLLKSPETSSKSYDRSSSGYMKRLSRFRNKGESPLVSPPVLKKVKNLALHEKYIDLLHVRDRRRKVAFSRCSKSVQNQKGGEENSVQIKDKIRAAKNALVSDAKDVIDKFRDSQANIMEAFSESEEIYGRDNDEDENML